MKTMIVHPFQGDVALYKHLGEVRTNLRDFFANPKAYDLVAFTGGEDVYPGSYGHRNLASSFTVERDRSELRAIEVAREAGLPMVGICRGAQILNVAFGGTMGQDIGTGHGGRHVIETADGESFLVNSLHHQLVVPTHERFIFARSEEPQPAEDVIYDGELPKFMFDKDGNVRITEAVYFPEERTFAVQYHPEWLPVASRGVTWYLDNIMKLLFGKELTSAAGGRS